MSRHGPQNLAQKLIRDHLVDGSMHAGEEIGLRIDQTLTQDATGTLVMLELEAMELDRVRTELSVQYVDHNLIQIDHRNPDDHLFLQSACERWGIWFSGAGNGVSHPLHQQYFGRPGRTLAGSDSHTTAAGALGMLAIGAGGLEVAMAMAGQPLFLKMPRIHGIRITGSLPDWVSAKDVILELLRRHGVDGAVDCVLEYHGPGLAALSAMDRHVIANMGTELGATASVFPADNEVRKFLRAYRREDDWRELQADYNAEYDEHEEIDLSTLEPLIARPSSPGNVVPVAEAAGEEIHQAYIGSSANPGYRDFAIAAAIVDGRRVHKQVSFDINPTSRGILLDLLRDGHIASLLQAGARLHQAGCNGCIGMGQAPATDKNSLRTVPRNFPGRSGTSEDRVFLVSPETAAASALSGRITDPRSLGESAPRVIVPERPADMRHLFVPPGKPADSRKVSLLKGPNIASLPDFEELPDELELPVLLALGDDVSTDEILPAGARVLPYRSNVPAISRFCFEGIDDYYEVRAKDVRDAGGHAIVAGKNYGQGSSREHAALAPRFLGLRVIFAGSFARIHRQNLVNFGILPLTFSDKSARKRLKSGSNVRLKGLHKRLHDGSAVEVTCTGPEDFSFEAEHRLSKRQLEIILAGGLINRAKSRIG